MREPSSDVDTMKALAPYGHHAMASPHWSQECGPCVCYDCDNIRACQWLVHALLWWLP